MGDETIAEALRIAERYLIRLGWRFTPKDVAKMGSINRQWEEVRRARERREKGNG